MKKSDQEGKRLTREKEQLRLRIAELEAQTNRQEQAEELLSNQRDLLARLGSTSDLNQALNLVLETVLQIEGIDCAGVYEIAKSSQEPQLVHQHGLPPSMLENAFYYQADSPQARLIASGKPYYGIFSELSPSAKKTKQRDGVRAFAIIPVQHEDEMLAVLKLASNTHHEIPLDTRQAIESIVAQIGGVLARVRTDEVLRESQLAQVKQRLRQEKSERERAREAQAQSEEKYRTLVEQSLQGIVVIQNGRIVFTNPAFAHISGYTVEELLRLSSGQVTRMVHPEDQKLVWGRLRSRLAGESVPSTYEFRGIRKDGSEGWLEMRASLIDYNGMPAVQGAFMDITKRKQGEQALLHSESRFRELAELLPETVYEMDSQGNITFMNRRAFEQFRYTQEDFQQGLKTSDLIIPQDRQDAAKNSEKILNGEKTGLNEYTALRKDGSTFPAMFHSSRIMRKGQSAGSRGFIIDLSERKKVEEELLRTQKLESIGTLAGGIAHDFNNFLTVILGCAALAKAELCDNQQLFEMLEQIENASARAKALTQQLLTFSQGGAPVKKIASISKIIRECSSFALSGSKARCEFDLASDLWPVEVDQGQIGQAISNLIINADQVMSTGGVIRVRARNLTHSANMDASLPPGRTILVSVEDQGAGIPEEHSSKIFDPYFTTRQEGSGLGLAVAYSIIKKHDGHITFDTRPGVGTTFHLYLPASPKLMPGDPEEKKQPAADKGKILVMDDEQMIRYIARRMLGHMGYEVELAADGAEAIRLYQQAMQAGERFHLVMLDLTVPGGMGGKQAIQELLKIDPQVNAIVSSGYSNDPIMSDFKAYGFRGVVTKPFGMDELCEAVEEAIKPDESSLFA